MTQAYSDRLAKMEGCNASLPVLSTADRTITIGQDARFLVQVKRGRTIEVIDLLCNASGFTELRAIVKSLKLGAILNWEPCPAPF